MRPAGQGTRAVNFPGKWRGFFDDKWHGPRAYDRQRTHKPIPHNIICIIGRCGRIRLPVASGLDKRPLNEKRRPCREWETVPEFPLCFQGPGCLLTQVPAPPHFPLGLQNLPLSFFHSDLGGMASMASQCSTTLPPSTRNRS